MYRVIIVDDEPWIVQSLSETLPWEEHGMRVVGGYTKASAALEAILAEKPDAVFTDIRMPVITGIQLMQVLREHQYDTEIVVISGFDQFDFVRDSLRMGAFDYCLKPLNESYMAELLGRLKKRLDQKARIRNNQLLELLTGDLTQAGDDPGFSVIPSGFGGYQVICVCSALDEAEVLPHLPLTGAAYISFSAGKYRYYLVNADQSLFAPSDEAIPGFDGSIGFSSFQNSLRDLPALISEAAVACEMRFMTGLCKSYLYHEPRISQFLPIVHRFVQLLAGEDAVEYSRCAASMPAYVISEELTIEELCFLGNQLILIAAGKPQAKELAADALCSDWRDLLERFSSVEDYYSHVYNACLPQSAAASEAAALPLRESTIGRMLQYLNENYTQQIFLKDLADQFYVNKNYASLLFKRHTGMTYSDYLNSLRLNRAKELLSSTALSISEVAEQSGYSDYFYFNKLFKKTFGITPAKFRRQPSP